MNIKIGDIELASRCNVCGGAGQVETSEDTFLDCGECDGVGWHITHDGDALAEFIDLLPCLPRKRTKS